MSGSHKEFPKKAVYIQLGLAALVGIGFLFADKPAVMAAADKVTKPVVEAAKKVLAPIGKVEVKEASVASAARTGEEVYASGCATCHDNGVAGAPKLDDKATWETRLTDGYAALVASAINGKGGMPARGGNPDNTDSEMELAVSHMIKKAGITLVAKSATTSAPPAPATSSVEAAPKAEETPAVEAKTVEAPKAESVETKVEAIKEEVTETVSEVKEEVVEKAESLMAKATEAVTETTAAVTEKVEEVKTEAFTAVAAATTAMDNTVDHSKGEAIYKSSCFACHAAGVAGSPKVGDKDAWTARIAAGNDAMYDAAINGKGAMPAKGGNMSISDDDIKAAVDYMAANSQ